MFSALGFFRAGTFRFEFLSMVFGEFKRLILTPAILAEVSNLSAARLPSPEKFLELLARLLPTAAFIERHPELGNVAAARGFIPFGFTDATIEELGALGFPVFTDDANLYQYLASRNVEVFNYNHIRMFVGNEDEWSERRANLAGAAPQLLSATV